MLVGLFFLKGKLVMMRLKLIFVTFLAGAVVLLAGRLAAAQQDTPQERSQDAAKQGEEEQEERQVGGYPVERERLVGGPTDVATDLRISFPQRDSLFPSLVPSR